MKTEPYITSAIQFSSFAIGPICTDSVLRFCSVNRGLEPNYPTLFRFLRTGNRTRNRNFWFRLIRFRLFRFGNIFWSDQVISSLEEVDKTSHHWSSSSRAIKLDLHILGHSCHSIRLFHHFPTLREFAYFWRSPDEPARKHAAPHFPWVTDVGLVQSHISTARMAGWSRLSKKPCHHEMWRHQVVACMYTATHQASEVKRLGAARNWRSGVNQKRTRRSWLT